MVKKDLQQLVDKYDREDFLRWLSDFSSQVSSSCSLGKKSALPQGKPSAIVVGGMGGSGISGDLLAAYVSESCSLPVLVVRGYELPAWIDESVLFVAVSYSGNTEETLTLYKEAGNRGCTRLAVTSGGHLGERASEAQDPVIKIPSGQPPRASAPYLFIPLVYVLANLGLNSAPTDSELQETLTVLEDISREMAPENANTLAMKLAEKIYDKTPLVYGSRGITAVLALRLKNQFNENAKMMAFVNEFPELNHNEIMGWKQLENSPEKYIAIFLRDVGEHNRVKKRFEICEDILKNSVSEVVELQSRGEALFCRFLSLMLLTDYVSYYTALLRGVDPSFIDNIESLKKQL